MSIIKRPCSRLNFFLSSWGHLEKKSYGRSFSLSKAYWCVPVILSGKNAVVVFKWPGDVWWGALSVLPFLTDGIGWQIGTIQLWSLQVVLLLWQINFVPLLWWQGPLSYQSPQMWSPRFLFYFMISSSSGVLISLKYWVGWYLGDFCDQRCSQYFFCICFPQISQF